jgi:hypothetical protein
MQCPSNGDYDSLHAHYKELVTRKEVDHDPAWGAFKVFPVLFNGELVQVRTPQRLPVGFALSVFYKQFKIPTDQDYVIYVSAYKPSLVGAFANIVQNLGGLLDGVSLNEGEPVLTFAGLNEFDVLQKKYFALHRVMMEDLTLDNFISTVQEELKSLRERYLKALRVEPLVRNNDEGRLEFLFRGGLVKAALPCPCTLLEACVRLSKTYAPPPSTATEPLYILKMDSKNGQYSFEPVGDLFEGELEIKSVMSVGALVNFLDSPLLDDPPGE